MVKSANIPILYNSFEPPLFVLPVWGSLVCCIFNESVYLFPHARRCVARVLLVASVALRRPAPSPIDSNLSTDEGDGQLIGHHVEYTGSRAP